MAKARDRLVANEERGLLRILVHRHGRRPHAQQIYQRRLQLLVCGVGPDTVSMRVREICQVLDPQQELAGNARGRLNRFLAVLEQGDVRQWTRGGGHGASPSRHSMRTVQAQLKAAHSP